MTWKRLSRGPSGPGQGPKQPAPALVTRITRLETAGEAIDQEITSKS